MDFSHIQPSVNYTIHKLTEVADLEGSLSICELSLTFAQEAELLRLLEKLSKP